MRAGSKHPLEHLVIGRTKTVTTKKAIGDWLGRRRCCLHHGQRSGNESRKMSTLTVLEHDCLNRRQKGIKPAPTMAAVRCFRKFCDIKKLRLTPVSPSSQEDLAL